MTPRNRDPTFPLSIVHNPTHALDKTSGVLPSILDSIHSLGDQEGILELLNQLPSLSTAPPALIGKLYYLLAERYRSSLYLELAETALASLPLEDSIELRGDCCVLKGQIEQNEGCVYSGIHIYTQLQDLVPRWKIGAAYMVLYFLSGEIKELEQAWQALEEAATTGETSLRFWYHYGMCSFHYGKAHQDPTRIRRAMVYLERSSHEEGRKEQVWSELLEKVSEWAQMTFRSQDIERANHWFEEGIAACPRNTNLWLLWGRMLFHCGWTLQSIHLLEAAFDKASCLALQKEASSARYILLSEILGAIALLADHGQCLYYAEQQLKKSDTHSNCAKEAEAFLSLIRAIYFGHASSYSLALAKYQQLNARNLFVKYTYAILYWEWGKLIEQPRLLQKSRKLLKEIRAEVPNASLYHVHYARLLYDLYQINPYQTHAQTLLEESLSILQQEHASSTDSMHLLIQAQIQGEYGYRKKNLPLIRNAIEITNQLYPLHGQHGRFILHHASLLKYQGKIEQTRRPIDEALALLTSLQRQDIEHGEIWLAIGGLHQELFLLESMSTDWSAAEQALLRAAQLSCKEADYALACLYALDQEFDQVYRYLKRAQERNGLPSIEQMQYDAALESVRSLPWFMEFLGRV